MSEALDLRYPIGRPHLKLALSEGERAEALRVIEETPARLREAVRGLNDKQLDTRYRDGGWSVRQVVHHVPDSHLNAYIRMKLALTEDAPTIKPYDEARWAELPDSRGPLESSLALLESVHERWLRLMRALSPADFARPFHHPEHPDAPLTIDWILSLYGWHGPHHIVHITKLRERMGW